MECSAVACLWPPSPPSHCISAVAAIQHPPSLFTGGSDGAIVRWAIYGHDVLPLALLCGHTAKIVDFALCFPAEAEPASSRPTHFNVPPASLLSACEDGVLCVWSAGSFRCRRRRKLPPWAGTPSHLTEILSFPHRICILCSSGESSKSSVLIVDSGTLLVVQTVFHGNLDVGSVKSLAIIPSPEEIDKEKQAVFLVDGSGKAQFLALSNEYGGPDGEGSSFMNGASSSDSLTSVCGESTSNNAAQAVALSQDGNLLALISDYHCEFRSVLDDTVMGAISSPGSSLEDSSQKLILTGGMFLNSVVHDNAFKTTVSDPDSQRCFVLWYNNGSAMVYIVSVLDTLVNSEPLYEVPGESLKSGGESLFHFCQLNDSLVRLESISFSQGDLLVWRPLITIWSIVKWCIEKEDVICSSSILLGEGVFSDFPSIYPTHKVDGRLEDSFHQRESVDSDNLGILSSRKAENGSSLEGRMISCLMVFADELYSQYAVIYGFYHGDIEVIWLRRPVLNTDSMKEDSLHHSNLHATKCSFLGHHGAVLCLAAHHIAASSNNLQVHRILMSGSRDFTVRLWDLDYGSLLLVMHHHIAPVKQIILPLAWTSRPWNDCFLTVGEDGCVALVSLETLRVERMFPGHPNYPSVVVWDSRRGYLACLCRNISSPSDAFSVLYIWDVNSGVRERIIHGSASHSVLDHFCKDIKRSILGGTTSASPLVLPIIDDFEFSQSHERKTYLGTAAASAVDMLQTQGALSSLGMVRDANSDLVINSSTRHVTQRKKHPIICSCPFPGIANLEFDLSTLVSLHCSQNTDEQIICQPSDHVKEQSLLSEPSNDSSVIQGDKSNIKKETLEGYLLRFSLCFLHLWDVDLELDKLLNEEMDVHKPYGFEIASGILGDRGSRTLMFPGLLASLELWKTSSEYCAMRSLLIVSLAQRMISLYHSTTIASSALAAFYTRNFAEKFPDQKPPLLQLLVSFWQDPSEHVRMAARSLFHCAAPRSIPHPLYCQKNTHPGATRSCVNENEQTLAWDNTSLEVSTENSNSTDYDIVSWLESFEIHEWVSCIGGTSQDAMASHIIVAAALVVWYPSKVKSNLAKHVAERLLKLVMSMNDRFSSTAAELLAEGMENSWKSCLGHEIPQLVGDILFQIECLSGTPAKSVKHNPSLDADIRDCLVGILLPSLAMADITGFLNVIEDQIWSTSSDSPVHIVSLKTLVRIVRSSPKSLALHIDKVMNYVLQTMDHSNLVMRKACLTTSLLTLREITRVLPMVALNESATRLAIGDAIGDIANVAIRVYDVQSVAKVKVLDASSPLGLPNFLEGASKSRMATAISALSFSPDGEGLVAFSENGLVLRWWSLGTVWWERLSRHIDPVQCTKLIFIPPWEGFSPNSSRSSIMANIVGKDPRADSEEKSREWDEAERIRLLLHNLDLSYRLQWVGSRRILLTRHSQEVGTFQM